MISHRKIDNMKDIENNNGKGMVAKLERCCVWL
jgi:hypothetical protein